MGDAVATLHTVVINTTAIEPLKEFWTQILGVGVARDIGGFFTWLEPQQQDGVALAFQLVPDPTEGRNRLHVDLRVPDLDSAQARIEELGGSHIESHDMAGFQWRVMADPDGNEFCLAPMP